METDWPPTVVVYVWDLGVSMRYWVRDPSEPPLNSAQSLLWPPVSKSVGVTFNVVVAGGIASPTAPSAGSTVSNERDEHRSGYPDGQDRLATPGTHPYPSRL